MVNESVVYANNVFEQPWWLDIVAEGCWKEAIVKEDDDGEVIGRMPYVYKNKKIIMPAMTHTLGPWITPKYRSFQNGNKQLSKQKEIINNLISQLPEYKSFNMYFDNSNEYILPYRWLGFQYRPTFSYRLDDLSDIDLLYSKVNKTVKKNVKSARNKTEIMTVESPEILLNLLDKTFEAQKRKTPGDRELKKKVISEAILRGNGKIFIAKDSKENIHSGAFLLFDSEVCYYLLGGSDPKFRSSGAQSLVLWEAIKFAAGSSRIFDFEGSNVESIENFFRQFGGRRVINYNIVQQNLFDEFIEIIKPRIKRMIGYKI